MNVSQEALEQHISYSRWATERLLTAAGELTPDELVRDFGTADKSILGTLAHVFRAEKTWLVRLQEKPGVPFGEAHEEDLGFLRESWPKLQGAWADWAGDLGAEGTERVLPYQDLKGNRWAHPIWQIVMHVVNHSTHHRGQAAGFLRAMGKTPPPLDFIAFVRLQK